MYKKKYTCNENYFEQIDSEDKAYWLGFFFADGNIKTKKTKNGDLIPIAIRLKLSDKDLEHVKLFKNNIQSNHPIREFTQTNDFNKESISNMCSFEITSRKLCADMIRWGCIPNKTFNLSFPNNFQIPSNLMHHFIRGYFDGDGWISQLKNKQYQVGFVSGCKSFLDSLKFFLLNQRINSSVYQKSKTTYYLNIINGQNEIVKFRDFLYKGAEIFLYRKKNKFDNINLIDREMINRQTAINRSSGKILQYDSNNNLINEWKCMKDLIAENSNWHKSSIYEAMRGKWKTVYGFVWKRGDK